MSLCVCVCQKFGGLRSPRDIEQFPTTRIFFLRSIFPIGVGEVSKKDETGSCLSRHVYVFFVSKPIFDKKQFATPKDVTSKTALL